MRKKWLSITSIAIMVTILTILTAYSAKPNIQFKNDEVSESVRDLTSSIPIDIMYFKGSDSKWTVEYHVIKNGENKKAKLQFKRNFGDNGTKSFKYHIETKDGNITGEIEFKNGGLYTIENLPIPEKNDNIKITLEWGNEKSTLELTNKITKDVISPEKALEYFNNEYIDNVRVSRIDFINDFNGKSWYISFSQVHDWGTSDNGVTIDALTGEMETAIGTH